MRPPPCAYCEECCYDQIGEEIERRPLGRVFAAATRTVRLVLTPSQEYTDQVECRDETFGIVASAFEPDDAINFVKGAVLSAFATTWKVIPDRVTVVFSVDRSAIK